MGWVHEIDAAGGGRRKRITYIHQYYKAPTDEDGGGTRSHEFAKRLVEAGFDVDIVTTERNGERFRGWRTEHRAGYTVHRLSIPYAPSMSYFARARAFAAFSLRSGAYARRLRGDLVFATSTPLTVIIPALVARVFRRTPQVFEVRDLWPELPIALGVLRGRVLIAAARWLEWLAYRTSTHIVALSPGMKEGVIAAGVGGNRVSVIPNSADLDTFGVSQGSENAWLMGHPELHGRHLVAYCGTLNRLNGVGYLVEIAKRTRESDPDIAYVVVGSGTESEIIRRSAQEAGVLGVNFFAYGRVPKQIVPQVMDAATVVTSLFIPLKEMEANSANKFFDGLAAGRPVAINYGGWQRDLLLENRAGLTLSSYDYDDAAAALIALVRDPGRREQFSRNARLLAERSFSRDRAAFRLANIFNVVLAEGD